MLDRRAQILLKTLVEKYISDGEPVGSRALSRFSGLDLSPATIRNVMADLEDLGLLESPHVSAGRLPTSQGLRYFVDGILEIGSGRRGLRGDVDPTQGRGRGDECDPERRVVAALLDRGERGLQRIGE